MASPAFTTLCPVLMTGGACGQAAMDSSTLTDHEHLLSPISYAGGEQKGNTFPKERCFHYPGFDFDFDTKGILYMFLESFPDTVILERNVGCVCQVARGRAGEGPGLTRVFGAH